MQKMLRLFLLPGWVLGSSFWFLVSGFWVLGSGFWISLAAAPCCSIFSRFTVGKRKKSQEVEKKILLSIQTF
jgi:hypothetical protein